MVLCVVFSRYTGHGTTWVMHRSCLSFRGWLGVTISLLRNFSGTHGRHSCCSMTRRRKNADRLFLTHSKKFMVYLCLAQRTQGLSMEMPVRVTLWCGEETGFLK
ncbi:hypothetical protein M758_10G049400 [Ceratodon purpureus]|nr:hypothetical protein M758_10G049400 [Ceratodon purpureus]